MCQKKNLQNYFCSILSLEIYIRNRMDNFPMILFCPLSRLLALCTTFRGRKLSLICDYYAKFKFKFVNNSKTDKVLYMRCILK